MCSTNSLCIAQKFFYENRVDLPRALKKHFGYDRFRPLQREIIEDALAERDVFVLMPTGGGKSLCFQLPALVRNGLTIVVSPLIALMKDQVDALQTSGIPATYLNSTLDRDESKARWRGLYRGQYRMLYVAPERLANERFASALARVRVPLLAVDEAHCISSWGHDFRPDYLRLPLLRQPALILRPRDEFWEAGQRARQLIRGSRLIDLPEHGASVFAAAPDLVARHAREFLNAT